MKIVPKGLNLEYLVKSKHLFEGNETKISEILRVGSKPLIEEKIVSWELYNQTKVNELETLKVEMEEFFSEEKVLEEINRVHVYGENVRKKDWTNKLSKIERDKYSVFINDPVVNQEETKKKKVVRRFRRRKNKSD